MGDFSKISGSYYRQTEDMQDPGKEREKDPNDLFSTATAIKRMNEQGGSDEEMRAQGPYPSTAASGLGTPDAPPADIGQKDLSTKGADDAIAGDQDFARAPVTKSGANEQSGAGGGEQQHKPAAAAAASGDEQHRHAAEVEQHEQELKERNARNNT